MAMVLVVIAPLVDSANSVSEVKPPAVFLALETSHLTLGACLGGSSDHAAVKLFSVRLHLQIVTAAYTDNAMKRNEMRRDAITLMAPVENSRGRHSH